MPLVGYAFLAGAIVWMLRRPTATWILRLRGPDQERVRIVAAVLVAALGAIGVAVLGVQLGEEGEPEVLGWAISGAVILGAVLYVAGLLAWRGGRAVGLRRIGWLLMVAAFAIPSTITLALPLAALLAPTLTAIPEPKAPHGKLAR